MSSFSISKVSFLKGKIKLPADKSITHRAIIISSISKGKTIIDNFSLSRDCLYTLEAFRKLGIKIIKKDLKLLVYGRGLYGLRPPKSPIFVGDSGTTFRLLCGVLAGQDFSSVLTAGKSLSRRPMLRVTQPLRMMGARIISESKIKNLKEGLMNFIQSMSEKITPKEIVEMAVRSGAKGIAYTYNEPAIFVEFAHDCMVLAKKRGLVNVFVSNGFESKESFNYIKDYLDAINIDLKSFNPEFYQKICLSKIEPVKENIKKYFQAGIETEVTTLIIPGKNDSREELTQIARFLAEISKDIPWHISAFYPAYKMLDVPPTPIETLIEAYEIGKKMGLKYVYVGNVYDPKRSSTFCPKCGALLIERNGYLVRIVGLKGGRCFKC
ncbi:MAG: AmmeMemoRadiSam system radical SAM enzyme, partial [Candidatus Omnitrophica bacterium]|nr:AmmeMemoRadiSam system radical SAM enzyme [Candidatus Omnitrophota bacterium]